MVQRPSHRFQAVWLRASPKAQQPQAAPSLPWKAIVGPTTGCVKQKSTLNATPKRFVPHWTLRNSSPSQAAPRCSEAGGRQSLTLSCRRTCTSQQARARRPDSLPGLQPQERHGVSGAVVSLPGLASNQIPETAVGRLWRNPYWGDEVGEQRGHSSLELGGSWGSPPPHESKHGSHHSFSFCTQRRVVKATEYWAL